MDPSDWRGPFQLGMLHEAVKAREEAFQFYVQAAELGANEWRPQNNLGKMLIEADDPAAVQMGVTLLERARELSQGDVPGVHFNLALGFYKSGDPRKAREFAEKTVRHPKATTPLKNQAQDFLRRI